MFVLVNLYGEGHIPLELVQDFESPVAGPVIANYHFIREEGLLPNAFKLLPKELFPVIGTEGNRYFHLFPPTC